MKKLISYLLFSMTTLHTILGLSPVMAMGCGVHLDKVEVDCSEEDIDCKKKIADTPNN